MGAKLRYASSEDVFKEMTERIGPLKGMTYIRLGCLGQKITVAEQHTSQAVSV
jgi:hypothetical protein